MRVPTSSIHRNLAVAFVVAVVLVGTAAPALAATNQGTGDIAGDASALAASNVFTLNSATLALVKKAFLSDGTPLSSGSSIPKGTIVKFLIYINNTTPVGVNDVSAQDVLDPTFAYQTGTIKVDNTVASCAAAACTAAEEALVFTAVDGQTARTDGVDGDVASYTVASKTIDLGNQAQTNLQLDIAASKVWAVLFTVKVQ